MDRRLLSRHAMLRPVHWLAVLAAVQCTLPQEPAAVWKKRQRVRTSQRSVQTRGKPTQLQVRRRDGTKSARLFHLVDRSLRATGTSPGRLLAKQIVQEYKSLSRTRVGPGELRDSRWLMSLWRDRTTDAITRELASGTEEPAAYFEILEEIKPRLSADDIARLEPYAKGEHAETVADLIADYGEREPALAALERIRSNAPHLSRLRAASTSETHLDRSAVLRRLGPAPIDKIKPYRGSNLRQLDFAQGKKLGRQSEEIVRELDQYDMLGPHRVRYRGLELETGDLVLSNLNLDDDGLLMGFTAEKSPFTHAAMFVVLQIDGRQIPSVLEIHEKGNRVVPLANFLGPHVHYAEVFRLPAKDKRWHTKVDQAVQKMQREERISYDFQSRPLTEEGGLPKDGDNSCGTCLGPPEAIYRRTGALKGALPRTKMTRGSLPNLDYLGMEMVRNISTPFDLVRKGDFAFVGAVDNRQYRAEAFRELVVGGPHEPGSVAHPMSHRFVNLKRLPTVGRISKLVELGIAQRKGFVARIITRIGGFRSEEVPRSAPPGTVGFYLTSNEATARANKTLSANEQVHALLDTPGAFSLTDLEADPVVRKQVTDAVAREGVSNWYQDKPVEFGLRALALSWLRKLSTLWR